MNRGRFRGNRGGRFPKNGGGGGGGSGGAGFIEGGGVVRLKGLFEKGVWHCELHCVCPPNIGESWGRLEFTADICDVCSVKAIVNHDFRLNILK